MDRQIDMLSDERKKFRKDSLSALSLEHRNQYTNDTIAVMMQLTEITWVSGLQVL